MSASLPQAITRPIIQFRCLHDGVIPPKRSSEGAGGFDLFARETTTIEAGRAVLVPTGYAVAIPSGWQGQVWPRSSAAVTYRLETGAGIIDADYRGEIGALIINESNQDATVERNTAVAQLCVVPHATESEVVEQLPDSERGAQGYGSTGNTL